MRRPLFNFLAVAGAVLLAALGVSAQAHGANLFSAFMPATFHSGVSTDTSGGSVEASGARENDNDQGEAPEASPSPEPIEAPEQDNDSQGDDNNDQGDNNDKQGGDDGGDSGD